MNNFGRIEKAESLATVHTHTHVIYEITKL